MARKTQRALWAVAALLALNAVLLAAQPGLALPPSLTRFLFGPAMVRAEVVVKRAGAVQSYRVDRGQVRAVLSDALVLRERDGLMVTVPMAPDVDIRRRGRNGRPLAGVRRGMYVETVREGDGPATQVFVLRHARLRR